MDMLAQYWNDFWGLFREGLGGVNPIQFGIIALLGMMAVSSFVGVFIAAALSVVIHVLVSALIPVIFDKAEFVAPAMNSDFGHMALTLYVLYFVVIGVLFAIKSLFYWTSHRTAHPAH
jgi:hypothetical protein